MPHDKIILFSKQNVNTQKTTNCTNINPQYCILITKNRHFSTVNVFTQRRNRFTLNP